MARERVARQEHAWLKLPVGLLATTAVVLFAAAPWPFALATLAPAAAAHAAVFDWGLRRPDAFPASAAFALGLLLDVVSGAVFGLGAMTCVMAHYAAAAQRRFLGPRGLGHAWLGLALAAFVLAPIAWAAASAYVVKFQPVGPVAAQAALTAALYPPLAVAFAAVRTAAGMGGREA